jgi:hypothetical protein
MTLESETFGARAGASGGQVEAFCQENPRVHSARLRGVGATHFWDRGSRSVERLSLVREAPA